MAQINSSKMNPNAPAFLPSRLSYNIEFPTLKQAKKAKKNMTIDGAKFNPYSDLIKHNIFTYEEFMALTHSKLVDHLREAEKTVKCPIVQCQNYVDNFDLVESGIINIPEFITMNEKYLEIVNSRITQLQSQMKDGNNISELKRQIKYAKGRNIQIIYPNDVCDLTEFLQQKGHKKIFFMPYTYYSINSTEKGSCNLCGKFIGTKYNVKTNGKIAKYIGVNPKYSFPIITPSRKYSVAEISCGYFCESCQSNFGSDINISKEHIENILINNKMKFNYPSCEYYKSKKLIVIRTFQWLSNGNINMVLFQKPLNRQHIQPPHENKNNVSSYELILERTSIYNKNLTKKYRFYYGNC